MATDDCEVVRRLFAEEVPEIANGIVEIMAIARKVRVHTKMAVRSLDKKVDSVGMCVGIRGSRIKRIVGQLGGERIDIFRWNELVETLIANALQPLAIRFVALDAPRHRATVYLESGQFWLKPGDLDDTLFGRLEENRWLASRLCGWEIDIIGGR